MIESERPGVFVLFSLTRERRQGDQRVSGRRRPLRKTAQQRSNGARAIGALSGPAADGLARQDSPSRLVAGNRFGEPKPGGLSQALVADEEERLVGRDRPPQR